MNGEHEPGRVILVGAGPGDPDLITVAGLAALRAADVVVYDRLAPVSLLRAARPAAKLIDAGKMPGGRGMHQDAINACLAEHATPGATVVRLKGGDSFVFGRGGEEALYLRERGIPFEVVPGVTSAIAAPAAAGIPVTHRGIAGTVLFATGHEAADGPGAVLHWDAIAGAADTLVFLMGVERLAEITAHLLAAGRPAEQPAALVRLGSTPEQEVLTATLATIAERARARGIRPPAILVVGDVVALRDQLAWLEQRPLFGARVLVPRAAERAENMAAALRRLGARPVEIATIGHAPVEDPTALDAALARLSSFDWVIFTSGQGVTSVMDRLETLVKDARAFGSACIGAVGPATARVLRDHALRADLVPDRASGRDIATALMKQGIAGKRVLLLCADIAPPELAEALRAAGAQVERVTAYRTLAGSPDPADLDTLARDGVDFAAFTSSSTVTHLLAALGERRAVLDQACIVTIGPATTATARAAGLHVAREAEEHTVDGLLATMIEQWAAPKE